MDSFAKLLPDLERVLRAAAEKAIEERCRLQRNLKSDGSIVTNADVAVEGLLRHELPHLMHDTAVWGEELGLEEPGRNGLWVVDPIDGTSNFSFGSPLWGITVALVQGPQIVLGGIVLPDLHEIYLCAKGSGVTQNGAALAPLPRGPVQPFELVSCCDSNARALGRKVPGKLRCNGAFVIDGAFVMCQRLRGMICGGERLYDAASCILFGQELGADIRYADGRPFDVEKLVNGEKIADRWIIFPADSGFQV